MRLARLAAVRSEAYYIRKELAYVQGNTSRHLVRAGWRQSRAEQTGSKVLQYGKEDNNGMSPRRIAEQIARD